MLSDAGGNPKEGTLLHAAVGFGRLDMIEFLVESGVDINASNCEPHYRLYQSHGVSAFHAGVIRPLDHHCTLQSLPVGLVRYNYF